MNEPRYWWKEAKVYELYVDKFARDFKGLAAELDYFVALGVNCLHLLPHYPSPMVDGGYDVTDYRAVRKDLGEIEDFSDLVEAAHARGIRIVIDWPLNHTSILHPWFAQARLTKENPTRDFYLWSKSGEGFAAATNAFPDIKPNDWIYNPPTDDYYFATFYPEQPDLNWDNPEVFQKITEAMAFWIEKGVDGFRLDAAPHLIKREGTDCKGLPETHALIKRIRAYTDSLNPEVILIAEAHQSLAETKRYFGNGDECHLAYHFGLAEEMWLALLRGDVSRVERMIDESKDIPGSCAWAIFLRNHDEVSLGTLSLSEQSSLLKLIDPEHRYVMPKSGRTAKRVGSIFNGNRKKTEEAFSMLYSLPGAPVMYYGDEIGMQNLPLGENLLDTRIYVRGAFDWDAARAQMKDPGSLFSAVSKLLRKTGAQIVRMEEPPANATAI